MNDIFEVTGADVAALQDEPLRALILRLCEADFWRAGYPISGVTGGGHQNASDGGIDVNAEMPDTGRSTNFLLRRHTGIQVKISDMSPADIQREMRPNGVLRPSIAALANRHGSYIIVSSKDSTTDSALTRRRGAMRDALVGSPDEMHLHTEFYDRDRIARWVALHPGVSLWVRAQIGKGLHGWQPYQNWSNSNEIDTESEYVSDDECRIYDDSQQSDSALAILDGIDRIRTKLATSGAATRIIGLSGLGKTRLVQALFDRRIGKAALPTSSVVYTDIGRQPNPSVHEMVSRLQLQHTPTILVVDNCNPEAHRLLALECVRPNSKVSLLTVEYDVRDDLPERTDVFRLEPASETVIQRLIASRYPKISSFDKYRLAEMSGGNARIALYIAATIGKTESVSNLSDAQLFDRLFYQNQGVDQGLLKAAKICALLYSFDSADPTMSNSEMSLLAGLAEMTIQAFNTHVAELAARQLIQKRGKWRAVLPHALANELASRALKETLMDVLLNALGSGAPGRIILSFSRRLQYLHKSVEARQIVSSWLQRGGMLCQIADLHESTVEILSNVVPVAPEEFISTVEQRLSEVRDKLVDDPDNLIFSRLARLLRSVAYRSELFPRAARMLAELVAQSQDRVMFCELFRPIGSGTHATQDVRLVLLRELVKNSSPALKKLAIEAAVSMLHTRSFTYSGETKFGAHSRDFGWHPQTHEMETTWFLNAWAFLTELLCGSPEFRQLLLDGIESRFSLFLVKPEIKSATIKFFEFVTSDSAWIGGWRAIQSLMSLHAEEIDAETNIALQQLLQLCHPKSLENQIRLLIGTESHVLIDIIMPRNKNADDEGVGYEYRSRRVMTIAETNGEAASKDLNCFCAVLPEFFNAVNGPTSFHLGVGLARGATDPLAVWGVLIGEYMKLKSNHYNISILRGFIKQFADRDKQSVEMLLDDAIESPALAPIFPDLQISVGVDANGIERLREAISIGTASAQTYRGLEHSDVVGKIDLKSLSNLIFGISELKDGYSVAVDIFLYAILDSKKEAAIIPLPILECGQGLLTRFPIILNDRNNTVYHIAEIAKRCLDGETGAATSKRVAERLLDGLHSQSMIVMRFKSLVEVLFSKHAAAVLTVFFDRRDEHDSLIYDSPFVDFGGSILTKAPFEPMLDWAREEPHARMPFLARAIGLFVEDETNSGELLPQAVQILSAAPDKSEIFSIWKHSIVPNGGWVGSLPEILMHRRRALEQLLAHDDKQVAHEAKAVQQMIDERMKLERGWEQAREERFE